MVLAAGAELNVPLPLVSLVRDQLIAAMAKGLGEQDWVAFAEVIAAKRRPIAVTRRCQRLLKNAAVITMDPGIGVLPCADLLIDDDKIAGIAPGIVADDVETVDLRGRIVIPGLVQCPHAYVADRPTRPRSQLDVARIFPRDACRARNEVHARRHLDRDAGRGLQPTRLRNHHAGRLVPQ